MHIRKMLPKEIMLPAIFVHRHKPGQHLHIGARNIPPGVYGSQAVLPKGQVLHFGAGSYGQARGAGVALGVGAVGINARRAAGGHDDIAAAKHHRLAVLQAQQTAHTALLR